jgi:hypothetical protein
MYWLINKQVLVCAQFKSNIVRCNENCCLRTDSDYIKSVYTNKNHILCINLFIHKPSCGVDGILKQTHRQTYLNYLYFYHGPDILDIKHLVTV